MAPGGRSVLTGREQDVFSRIAAGMSNGEIAASLFLSEAAMTVNSGMLAQARLAREANA